MKTLGTAAQNNGISRLQTQTTCISRDIRTTFVNHPDHTQRHSDLANGHSIRSGPLVQFALNGIIQGRNVFKPFRHTFNAIIIKHQTIGHSVSQALGLRRFQILDVGRQQIDGRLPLGRGHGHQGFISLFGW